MEKIAYTVYRRQTGLFSFSPIRSFPHLSLKINNFSSLGPSPPPHTHTTLLSSPILFAVVICWCTTSEQHSSSYSSILETASIYSFLSFFFCIFLSPLTPPHPHPSSRSPSLFFSLLLIHCIYPVTLIPSPSPLSRTHHHHSHALFCVYAIFFFCWCQLHSEVKFSRI